MQQVAEIAESMRTIAVGAVEQSTAMQEVNSTVNEMDRGTLQNAAMLGETSAAARAVQDEAEKLAVVTQASHLVAKSNQTAIKELRPTAARTRGAIDPRPARIERPAVRA